MSEKVYGGGSKGCDELDRGGGLGGDQGLGGCGKVARVRELEWWWWQGAIRGEKEYGGDGGKGWSKERENRGGGKGVIKGDRN